MPTFDIYGRFTIEIIRQADRWAAYRVGNGTKIPITDFVIPSDFDQAELGTYLDDVYHELAKPGQMVRLVSP